jgi:hypothetical protein
LSCSDAAATPASAHAGSDDVTRLSVQLARAERRIAELEAVIEAVRRAQTWDFTLYDQAPGEEWLAIDRERYEELIRCITRVVHWRPWRTRLEPRLGAL